jgi:type IV pilus assembly protein PilF
LILVLVASQGCVTTHDGSFSRKIDRDKATEQYVELGLEYIKRDDLQRARKHLTRALEINDEDASAHSALGLVYHQEGELKLAEKSFQSALRYDPAFTRGRTYYGAFLYSQERYAEAMKQFERAAEDTAFESRAQVFANLALCHIRLGNTEQALVAYERTLRLDRSNGRALSGATELLLQSEQFDKAQQYYNALVALIREQGLKHSAQSLWQGIRIARHLRSVEQERSLAEVLATQFPESQEYADYLASKEGGHLP